MVKFYKIKDTWVGFGNNFASQEVVADFLGGFNYHNSFTLYTVDTMGWRVVKHFEVEEVQNSNILRLLYG